MLRPETQDLAVFADGMDNICVTHQRVAQSYFDDGTIALACPPLRALLHIMRDGTWEGRGAGDPVFRALFTRESLLASDWYRARLEAQRSIDAHLAESHARYLEKFLTRSNYADVAARLDIRSRLAHSTAAARAAREPAYLKKLTGTIGAEPAIAAGLVKHLQITT